MHLYLFFSLSLSISYFCNSFILHEQYFQTLCRHERDIICATTSVPSSSSKANFRFAAYKSYTSCESFLHLFTSAIIMWRIRTQHILGICQDLFKRRKKKVGITMTWDSGKYLNGNVCRRDTHDVHQPFRYTASLSILITLTRNWN